MFVLLLLEKSCYNSNFFFVSRTESIDSVDVIQVLMSFSKYKLSFKFLLKKQIVKNKKMRGETQFKIRKNVIFLSLSKNWYVMDQYFSGTAHIIKTWFREDPFLLWDLKKSFFLSQKSVCVPPHIFLFLLYKIICHSGHQIFRGALLGDTRFQRLWKAG